MKIGKGLSVALAVVLMLGMTTSAQAVLWGVKTIRLTQNLTQTFQIAEIRAFETGTGINQSLPGTASALNSAHGTAPSDVNDGSSAQNHGSGSVWHSASQQNTWVQLDLAVSTNLDSIEILGRSPCCTTRQNDFQLQAWDAGGQLILDQQVLGLGSEPSRSRNIQVDGGTAPNSVPEPMTLSLLAIGGAGLMIRRKRHA